MKNFLVITDTEVKEFATLEEAQQYIKESKPIWLMK
jgi:hypothetical protein